MSYYQSRGGRIACTGCNAEHPMERHRRGVPFPHTEDCRTFSEDTDCRSEIGITVGLIDSVISICRVLAARSFDGLPVVEALKDLRSDSDVHRVFIDPVLIDSITARLVGTGK